MDKPLQVLIVDDSGVFRSILRKIISSIPGVQVMDSVGKGSDALDFLKKHAVDIMTLDVEMPDMNGLEILQRMIAQKASFKAMPDVLMVSSLTRKGSDITLKALELGAFDFIAKPGAGVQDAQGYLANMFRNVIAAWRTKQLLSKREIRTAPVPQAVQRQPVSSGPAPAAPFIHKNPAMAIVLGVSTGGPKSLSVMLPKLCECTDLPILMVQHMPPNFTKSLAESLATKCRHKAVEGEPGMIVQRRHIYVAPGGSHMTVRSRGVDYVLETNRDPPQNGCRPSVDVLFRSAAQTYPDDSLIGIILTGMGNDGAPSLPDMKRKHAYLIAQDEESSVVFGMPRAAAATGLLDKIASLLNIPDAVLERIRMVES